MKIERLFLYLTTNEKANYLSIRIGVCADIIKLCKCREVQSIY